MTQEQVNEGEFKSFIKRMGLPEVCKALLLENVDKAKKEFPVHPTMRLQFSDKGSKDICDWFVKWFGDAV